MSGVKLGGRESDLTIPECGLAIMVGVKYWHFQCVYESGSFGRLRPNNYHRNSPIYQPLPISFLIFFFLPVAVYGVGVGIA